MKKIILSQNKFALVDDEDFEYLNQWRWCVNNGYAVRHQIKREYETESRKMVKMHKLIMKTPDNMETDHINHDGLDNRKANLRIVTTSQNQLNQKLNSRNTSGFKGVYWDKKYKKWCARITIMGKKIFGGGYLNKMDASNAYQTLLTKYG